MIAKSLAPSSPSSIHSFSSSRSCEKMASAACGMLIEPDLIASSWVWKSKGMNRSVSIWYMVAGLLEYVATVVLIVRLEAVRLYLPLAIANEYILVDLGRFLGRHTHSRWENPGVHRGELRHRQQAMGFGSEFTARVRVACHRLGARSCIERQEVRGITRCKYVIQSTAVQRHEIQQHDVRLAYRAGMGKGSRLYRA